MSNEKPSCEHIEESPYTRDMPLLELENQSQAEHDALKQFGYKQELKRHFSIWSLIAFGIVSMTPSSAISNTLQAPLMSGGSSVMIWGYIIVAVFTMCVAVSMAEIGAMYPVAGGPLSWSYMCSSPKYRIMASWFTGYFNIFGQICFTLAATFQGVSIILGIVGLYIESYHPERYHYVLLTIALTILWTVMNIFLSHKKSASVTMMLIYTVTTMLITIVVLLATSKHRHSAKYIFTSYNNQTGWSSHGYVFILGLLQSAFTFTGYDSVTHLAEESTDEPSKVIPKALVIVMATGLVYGFIFTISVCASLGNVSELLSGASGLAFIELLHINTKNKVATILLSLFPAFSALFAAETFIMANSRTIYAFARDGAFVFPKLFSRVYTEHAVPIPALLFSAVIQCILVLMYLASDVVFNTIISLTTIGHEICYCIPIYCMLVYGRKNSPVDRPWNMGSWGVFFNIVSVLWLSFISITMCFPTEYPVTGANMNYTSVIVAIVIVYSIIVWFVQGKHTYKGPGEVIEELVDSNMKI